VELLASLSEPISIASIASRLELNRSTATVIMAALERAGWASRHTDRRYTLGVGLIRVAEAVRAVLPLDGRVTSALEELAQQTGCGATLAFASTTDLTFLSVAVGRERFPAGVDVGVRLPLIAPVGAAVIAHRDPRAQREWLQSGAVNRPVLADMLAQVRQSGVAVFGMGNADPQMLNVLAEVAELLAEHPRRAMLRQRVFEMLIGLSGHPYSARQLASSNDLSVGYLAAPVFDEDGHAAYELQLGPLRTAVSPAERDSYMREIKATAARLSAR
jgi:DNA-binding IclR family transcriptional regulator